MPLFRLGSVRLLPREIFRTDFPQEWMTVALLAIGAWIWSAGARFYLAIGSHDLLLPGLALTAILIAHGVGFKRASVAAEYFLLTVAATAVFGVISYLSMATGRPLADPALRSADAALGFDWLSTYHWILHHPIAAKVLEFAYDSLVYQGLYFAVLFGIMGRRDKLREMFWLVLMAGVLTSAGAALFPALGPFKQFGIHADFLPVMERLRSGNLHFALSSLTGVVSFPSFHTTMAVFYIYGFRNTGIIGWAMALLNIMMLPAIPFCGGHYLADMLAGGAVALLSFAAVRAAGSFAATRACQLSIAGSAALARFTRPSVSSA